MSLITEAFRKDPRLAKIKKQVLQVLKEHQSRLTGVKPANPKRKVSYQEALDTFGERRAGKLFYPFLGSGIGRGSLVELADGSVKYDFISNIGTHWGHGDPKLVEACLNAALTDAPIQGNLQQNMEVALLAELFCKISHMEHVFFTTSGAMADENGLKVAFQKNFPANRILAFEGCFMGRTHLLCQITDRPANRSGLPSDALIDYVPFFDPEKPKESTKEAVRVLKQHLARHPKEYAVMSFELIQGEGGFRVGHRDFFVALMEVLKEHHVAVLVDEVQTFGRTTRLFAFQHFKLEKYVDIVTVGKLTQVCATMFTEEYKPRPNLLGQTFISPTSAVFTSKYIIDSLLHGKYLGPKGKNQKLFEHCRRRFMKMEKKHPGLIRGPYGVGAMICFTPFDGSKEKVLAFVHALFEAGVIAFNSGGSPMPVRFLLPIGGITFEDLDKGLDIVEKTLIHMKKKK